MTSRASFAAAVLVAAAAMAQDTLPRASERLEVSVVEVDVVVTDAHGKAVTGLTRRDFELTVGGQRRELSNFYAVDRNAELAQPAAGKSETAEPVARRDYIVLFVDDVHLSNRGKKTALAAMRAFAAQHIRRGTAAMLVSSDGSDVRVLERFTEDAGRITRRIDELAKQPARLSEYEHQRRDLLNLIDEAKKQPEQLAEIVRQQIDTIATQEQAKAEQTIDALDHVVHAISGLDGRRTLVYLSDGVPLQPAVEIFNYYHGDDYITGGTSDREKRVLNQFQPMDAMRVNLSDKFQQLAKSAALAGVQFFAIDARGVRGFEEGAPDTPQMQTRIDSPLVRTNLQTPLELLAEETGGQAIINRNDMNAAFTQLDDRLSTYYSLGFRSDNTGHDEDISVRVRKPGMTAHAVKHIRQRSAREEIADRVRSALYARGEENPLGIKLNVTPAAAGFSAMFRVPLSRLSMLVNRSSSDTAFVVFVAMLDASGRETPVRMFVHRIKPDETLESVQSLQFDVAPGTYIASFAVADGYSWQASYLQRDLTIGRP